MLPDILLLLFGLSVLILGGELLVEGSKGIAKRFRIKPLVVGLTIVAFGTSCPELAVSVQSAIAGHPDMVMGNVVGSNICNISLILAFAAVISPIRIKNETLKIDLPMAVGSSLLMYIWILISGVLKRIEGILFVIILITYIIFLIYTKKEDKPKKKKTIGIRKQKKSIFESWYAEIAMVILGSLGLSFGSGWFLMGTKNVFLSLGVEERIIGILILAGGTSLPELFTSVSSVLKKSHDLATGNVIGSNIFNILSILGITSIISDIHVSETIINYDIPWMLGITFILFPLIIIKKKLGRWQGIILLAIYSYYIYSVLK